MKSNLQIALDGFENRFGVTFYELCEGSKETQAIVKAKLDEETKRISSSEEYLEEQKEIMKEIQSIQADLDS